MAVCQCVAIAWIFGEYLTTYRRHYRNEQMVTDGQMLSE